MGTWSTSVSQSTSKAGNEIPTITDPGIMEVSEDSGSGSAVGDDPVEADDTDSTLALSYDIEGPNDDLFTIDSIGQIKTRKSLNHEDSRCSNVNNLCEYMVRVKVSDRDNGSDVVNVTISVTDVEEPPSAPASPTVTATADTGRSLEVTWNEPTNTGPPIEGYEIAYRKYRQGSNQDEYQVWPHTGTEREATITTIQDDNDTTMPLEPRTQYEVKVRARNGEGDVATGDTFAWGDYSSLVRGTTGGSNVRPEFSNTDSLITLLLPENTRGGQNVGSAVEATDADRGNRLTYSLEGPGKDSFTITSTGQIRTKSGVTYDYESRQGYSVTVKVDDGQRKDNSVATKSVTIEVEDRDEPPSTPSAPSVVPMPGSTDSVRVAWDEPNNTGPPITDYDVQCPNCPERVSHVGVDRSMIITGLTPGTRYNVQVRAWNDEGTSGWSRSGSGAPNPDVANRNPAFSSRTVTLSVPENTLPSTDIGNPVAATDQDGDPLTYALEGTDADSFDILSTIVGGQIRTSAALNHEEKSSYSVTVRVTDGRGGTDAANVTINVTDVGGEAPETPLPPTVTAVSSTSLQVTWEAPENSGPPITDYDYQYRNGSASWTEVTNTTITGTTVTIERLTASTFYDVEVRAKNDEGTSGWSNSGNGSTNAAGANNPPVFTEGASATRSVSATAPAGTLIGAPVRPTIRPFTATDADSGDTLTYSIEGADAASFGINPANGQLLTVAGVTLDRSTYIVEVVASDGSATSRITVTITVTPNRAPVFSEGANATRSVAENEPAGTNVGSPVVATDLNQGDTLTYTLDGADAGSFTIVPTSGQIRTNATLDYETKASYVVTVTATDGSLASASIVVTISVIQVVVHDCAGGGAVADAASNRGLVSDCEALLSARNTLEGRARLDWSESTPIEQWEGVSISGTPMRVTRLNLMDRGLSGTIPASLGRLSMLTHLNLRSNPGLSGEIPDALGNLSNLRLLNLHSNSHTGAVPDLRRIAGLEELYLANNADYNADGSKVRNSGLTGRIPTWLNGMTNMEELWLWGNSLTGTVPNLSGMTSLEKLKLANNNLTGGVPAGDMLPPNVTWLIIDSNGFSGSIPDLSGLTSLRLLWLHSNDLTGEIPAGTMFPASVDDLNLRDNMLTGAIPDLSRLDMATRVRLHGNMLTGEVPASLGRLDSLKQLWLWENDLTSINAGLGDLSDTLIEIGLEGNPWSANACVPESLANVTTNDYTAAGIDVCDGS